MLFFRPRASSKALQLTQISSRALEFGRHLVAQHKISQEAFDRAEQTARESRERLEYVFTRLGIMGEREFADALADFLDLPKVCASDFPDTAVLEDRFSEKFVRDTQILPLANMDEHLRIAIANPLDSNTIDAVQFAIGKPVFCFVAYPADIQEAHARLYGAGKSEFRQILDQTVDVSNSAINDDVDRLKDIASDAPVIRLVNLIITKAVEARASDIHIEPMEDRLRVRYRIDGVLQEIESPPQRLAAAVISRIKVMAKLNIAERRLAQDGRISFAVRGKDIDFRVATIPTLHGESLVLRILDRGHLDLDFASLGFDEILISQLRSLIAEPHGILLVTGPTGSGKTTTLYAALLELNTPDRKILTIEDPVEYQLDGINQVQVKPQIGLNFANTLRSFLRHDPDIMMIGEVRDLETAEIAVQAALTGHLILSTLHTNDAASAITRLLDMGVEDFLLTSTINGVAAQRLVRTLCVNCKEPYAPVAELIERLNLHSENVNRQFFRAKGCSHCNGTGFRGRSSIVEIMPVTDQTRQLLLKGTDATSLQRHAVEAGMRTMQQHGLQKVLEGYTTLDEVLRVTRAN